ncbi:MAG: hypothetical protein OEY64_03165 [Nitrospinota bacterium]|nr:hypothetical protein [Nitrospinota bacterium]
MKHVADYVNPFLKRFEEVQARHEAELAKCNLSCRVTVPSETLKSEEPEILKTAIEDIRFSHKGSCAGVEAAVAEIEKRLRYLKNTRMAAYLKAQGFSERDIRAVLFSPLNTLYPAWQAVDKYMRGGYEGRSYGTGDCLILAGPPDAGKTFAAVWGAAQIRKGQRYIFCSDISPKLRHEQGFLEWMSKAPFLVLDDYNGAGSDPHFNEALKTVFHHRHAGKLATIVTTNKNMEDFKASLPEVILSRLSKRRGGWGVFVEVAGKGGE